MKRDVVIEPFDEQTDLVIACDNSGAIGEKTGDAINVSYETTSYFAYRVAFMECVAAGGKPFVISLQNFNGDSAWDSLVAGIQKGMEESGDKELRITGSTESNFSLEQSAFGVTLLGRKARKRGEEPSYTDGDLGVAVIGSPLVGESVITKQDQIAPLHMFQTFYQHEAVLTVVPVGSKGIEYELSQLFPKYDGLVSMNVDVQASSGPATCFIIVYVIEKESELEPLAEGLFHNITFTKK